MVQVGKTLQPAAVRAPVGPTPEETDDAVSLAKTDATGKEAEGSDLLKAMLSSVEAIERQLTDGMLTEESPAKQPARDSSGGVYAPWFSGVRLKAAKKDVAADLDETPAQPDLETYVSWLKTIRSETEVETKRFREAFFNKGASPTKSQGSSFHSEAASLARSFANTIYDGDVDKQGAYSPTDSMNLGEDYRPYMRIPAIIEEDSTASGDTSGEAEQRHHSASSSSAPRKQPRSEVALLSEVSDLKRALQHEVRQREHRGDQPLPPNVYFASDEVSIANSANSDEHEERKEAELRMRLAGAQLHSQEAQHHLAAIRAHLQGTKAEQELLRQYDDEWRGNRYRENVRLSSEEADDEEPRSMDDMTTFDPLRNFSSSWGSSSNGTRRSRPRNPSPPSRKQRIHAIEAV